MLLKTSDKTTPHPTPPRASNVKECSHTQISPSYLKCDCLITVLLCSAPQCKFFPFSQASLLQPPIVMHHLSVYQLFLFTRQFQCIPPLVEHARHLAKRKTRLEIIARIPKNSPSFKAKRRQSVIDSTFLFIS